MNTLTTIEHNSILYEVSFTRRRILKIRKVMKDSGMERDVLFDNVPTLVQEEIRKVLEKGE